MNQGMLGRLLALVVTLLFSGFTLHFFTGSLPLYLAHRGFSVPSIGLVVGVAYVPQLLAPLFAGPLVDRWGPRVAIRAGTALFLVAALLFLLSGTAIGLEPRAMGH